MSINSMNYIKHEVAKSQNRFIMLMAGLIFLNFLGSGPEGVDDLCFQTHGEFSPPPSPSPPPPPQPNLEAQILAWRPRSQP